MEPKNTTDSKTFSSSMTLNEYQALAMRSSKPLDREDQMVHAAMGLTSEAGELMTAVKAATFYNKPLDEVNAIEELGDVLWFLQLGATALGVSLEEIARTNISKLQKRYPKMYSDADAIARADKNG